MTNTTSTDADRLRDRLAEAGLSVRGGAKALGLSRDKLRDYTEGRRVVPQYLWLALDRLVQQHQDAKLVQKYFPDEKGAD